MIQLTEAGGMARDMTEPPARYHLFLPESLGPATPLLVCVHGISRNAEEHLRSFAPLAAARGIAVLAPIFAPAPFPDYQRLGRQDKGLRADLALQTMLDRLARQAGLAPNRIYLFGHSGGAQFVHRYTMAYPTKVVRYVVSAAGWYTLPDPALPYPFGTGPNHAPAGITFEPQGFLRVPGAVLVGTNDRRRGTTLRKAHLLDATQGRTRIERAERWVSAMNVAAVARGLPPPLRLQLVTGAGHRFGAMATHGAVAQAFDFLFGSDRHA